MRRLRSWYDRNRTPELKIQHRFRTEHNLFAFACGGNTRACACAHGSSDGGTLGATKEPAQDGAQGCSSTHLFSRALAAGLAPSRVLAGLQVVLPPVDGKLSQLQRECGTACEPARALGIHDFSGQLVTCRHYGRTRRVREGGVQGRAKAVSGMASPGINFIQQPNRNAHSLRNGNRPGLWRRHWRSSTHCRCCACVSSRGCHRYRVRHGRTGSRGSLGRSGGNPARHYGRHSRLCCAYGGGWTCCCDGIRQAGAWRGFRLRRCPDRTLVSFLGEIVSDGQFRLRAGRCFLYLGRSSGRSRRMRLQGNGLQPGATRRG